MGFKSMRPLLIAAVLAVGVAGPAMARQQGLADMAAAPSAEAETLGVKIAHLTFAAMDMKAMFSAEIQKSGDLETFSKVRPNWPRLMAEAVSEEITADMPRIEALFGHAMAGYFTLEEMRAGVLILGDPEMQGFIHRKSLDDSARLNPRALSPAVRKAIASAAGQRFAEKFGNIDVPLASIEGEMGVMIIPGVFRRFADKADAEEAARKLRPNTSAQ